MATDGSDELRVLCPTCPLCGSVPPFIYPSFAQAFCTNEDCDVILWEPWVSLAQNLMNANTVKWHDGDGNEVPAPE